MTTVLLVCAIVALLTDAWTRVHYARQLKTLINKEKSSTAGQVTAEAYRPRDTDNRWFPLRPRHFAPNHVVPRPCRCPPEACG